MSEVDGGAGGGEKVTNPTEPTQPEPKTAPARPQTIHPFFIAKPKPIPSSVSDERVVTALPRQDSGTLDDQSPTTPVIHSPEVSQPAHQTSHQTLANHNTQPKPAITPAGLSATALAELDSPTETTAPTGPEPSPTLVRPATELEPKRSAVDAVDLTASDSEESPPVKTKARARKPNAKRASAAIDDDDEVIVRPTLKSKTARSTRNRAGTTKAKAKANNKSKAANIASTDDDGAVRSTPRTKAKLDKGKGKAVDLGVIEIPDSPPPQKPAVVRPLGELSKMGQEKRRAQAGIEARWPTTEEHTGGGGGGKDQVAGHSNAVAGPSSVVKPRWASSLLHFSSAVTDCVHNDEPEMDVFDKLSRQLHGSTSPASLPQAPTLVTHSLSALSTLVPSFISHPLLDRLAAPLRAPESYPAAFVRHSRPAALGNTEHKHLFTTKYGPRTADEMIGTLSRRSAGELKAWFEELAICNAADAEALKGGQKRRPIERGSKHRKRRKRATSDDDDDDDLDGFVVNSDEDEDDDLPSAGGSDDEALDPDSLRPQASTVARRNVFPSLTNLILLHGPSGSGKTSAVHAVANELGWSVFEVWPGVGKRGAKDIERLVGDVSKNHMVRKGGQVQGGLASMFKKAAVAAEAGESAASAGAEATEGATKQSVILFDEVDVLFREEKDFWTGLMALASESQRPIVVTCTDTTQIPFADLALQPVVHGDARAAFLSFASPEPSIAVPYLQLVALSEGHILPQADIAGVYDQTRAAPLPVWYGGGKDWPTPARAIDEAEEGGGDIRRALMRLQLDCGWRVGAGEVHEGETEWSEGSVFGLDCGELGQGAAQAKMDVEGGEDGTVASLQSMAAWADALSFADAFVARRQPVNLLDFEPSYLPSAAADDQLEEDNWRHLELPAALATRLPSSAKEQDIAFYLSLLAEAALPWSLRQSPRAKIVNEHDLEARRTARLSSAIDLLMTLAPGHPPSVATFTDTLPFAVAITLADEAREAEQAVAAVEAAGGAMARNGSGTGGPRVATTSRRSTRLAGIAPYKHTIDWYAEDRALVRGLGLLA